MPRKLCHLQTCHNDGLVRVGWGGFIERQRWVFQRCKDAGLELRGYMWHLPWQMHVVDGSGQEKMVLTAWELCSKSPDYNLRGLADILSFELACRAIYQDFVNIFGVQPEFSIYHGAPPDQYDYNDVCRWLTPLSGIQDILRTLDIDGSEARTSDRALHTYARRRLPRIRETRIEAQPPYGSIWNLEGYTNVANYMVWRAERQYPGILPCIIWRGSRAERIVIDPTKPHDDDSNRGPEVTPAHLFATVPEDATLYINFGNRGREEDANLAEFARLQNDVPDAVPVEDPATSA